MYIYILCIFINKMLVLIYTYIYTFIMKIGNGIRKLHNEDEHNTNQSGYTH